MKRLNVHSHHLSNNNITTETKSQNIQEIISWCVICFGTLSLLALLVLANFGCSSTRKNELYDTAEFSKPPQEFQQPSPIFRGFEFIKETEDSAIGKICIRESFLNTFPIGSGVLIDPIHVITASHVVDNDLFEYSFCTNGNEYCVDSISIHPKYRSGSEYFIDLAILTLDTPCLDVEPAVLPDSVYPLHRGDPLTAIGYGGGLKKRSLPGIFWFYGVTFDSPHQIKMLCYEGSIWYGDSGGAIMNEDKVLVGIISTIGKFQSQAHPDCDYIFENSSTRLDLYADWIKQETNFYSPSCKYYVPVFKELTIIPDFSVPFYALPDNLKLSTVSFNLKEYDMALKSNKSLINWIVCGSTVIAVCLSLFALRVAVGHNKHHNKNGQLQQRHKEDKKPGVSHSKNKKSNKDKRERRN